VFYIEDQKEFSYDNLIQDVSSGQYRNVFSSFVGEIINNEDLNLSSYKMKTNASSIKINSKQDLLKKIRESNSNIILETSGTTGEPKLIKHKISDIIGNCKISNDKSVWLFTYNKFHMGGIQVFLQAIINGDTLVDGYKLSKEKTLSSIEDNLVTNISATPTFYRMLMPIDKKFYNVKRITLGGEKSNSSLISDLRNIFPNCKINNIYATTETGAVLFSKTNVFKLNQRTKIDNNELLVLLPNNQWYNTGDIVSIQPDGSFVFNGRNKKIINLGGRNVNPSEIEELLKDNPNIVDAVLYSKTNSLLGNVLCSDVVLKNEMTKNEIKDYLSGFVEEYKIPRIINFKKRLKVSENNKVIV
jgi:acyl-coenzyme A synthetase/AMP-(fatty) acid ligase